MCNITKIGNAEQPEKIIIEQQRDASIRAVEVIIVNHNKMGEEGQGLALLCHDNGKITFRGNPVDMRAGMDIGS